MMMISLALAAHLVLAGVPVTNPELLREGITEIDPWDTLRRGPIELEAPTGERFDRWLDLFEVDVPGLRLRAEGLPRGASMDERGQLVWTPSDDQTGVHHFTVIASDGKREERIPVALTVLEQWHSFFLPGVRYTAFLSEPGSRYGLLHGISVELAIVTWIHRNENRGPSHGRVYLAAELLQCASGIGFLYAAGFGLSVERNPHRRWLIPYFGAEVGGLVHPVLGHGFQVMPFAGLHLWSSRNLSVNLLLGYRVVPRALEELRGPSASVGVDFSLW